MNAPNLNRYILTPYSFDEKEEGLVKLAEPSWYVNMPNLPKGDRMARMSVLHESLAGFVCTSIRAGERPVSIADDCCAAIGVMAGLQRAGLNPVLVWFDAHGDFNTWETSPSGFLGGMPLAMMVGRGDQRLVTHVGLQNLSEERVILTGARDLDPAEKEAIENSKVHFLPDVQSLMNHPSLDSSLYVHFDVDVINPEDAPAVGYMASGGPSADELREVFRFLRVTGKIVAASLCTWNTQMEGAQKTERVCMESLKVLVGEE